MGEQSKKFFDAYAAAGGELDEIVLDTELGWLGFDTWEIAGALSSWTACMRACVLHVFWLLLLTACNFARQLGQP